MCLFMLHRMENSKKPAQSKAWVGFLTCDLQINPKTKLPGFSTMRIRQKLKHKEKVFL